MGGAAGLAALAELWRYSLSGARDDVSSDPVERDLQCSRGAFEAEPKLTPTPAVVVGPIVDWPKVDAWRGALGLR